MLFLTTSIYFQVDLNYDYELITTLKTIYHVFIKPRREKGNINSLSSIPTYFFCGLWSLKKSLFQFAIVHSTRKICSSIQFKRRFLNWQFNTKPKHKTSRHLSQTQIVSHFLMTFVNNSARHVLKSYCKLSRKTKNQSFNQILEFIMYLTQTEEQWDRSMWTNSTCFHGASMTLYWD